MEGFISTNCRCFSARVVVSWVWTYSWDCCCWGVFGGFTGVGLVSIEGLMSTEFLETWRDSLNGVSIEWSLNPCSGVKVVCLEFELGLILILLSWLYLWSITVKCCFLNCDYLVLKGRDWNYDGFESPWMMSGSAKSGLTGLRLLVGLLMTPTFLCLLTPEGIKVWSWSSRPLITICVD